MRTPWTLALALLGACGSDSLDEVDGKVTLSPSTLPIEAYVGYGRVAVAKILNGSRAPQTVTLQVSSSVYRLQKYQRTVPAGGEEIKILFEPPRARDFPAELQLTVVSTGQTSSMTLLGYGLEPPPCAAASPCDFAEFDPETGDCHRGRLPEGSACSTGNGCQVEERCLEGQCVGVARDCDDDDVCTDDSCNPLLGQCVHLEIACPEPEEACKVAACHAVTGCYLKNAPGGTVCGEFSCREAQFCREGECITEIPPEDYPCVRPCGEGVCQSQKCVRTDGFPGELLESELLYQPDRPIAFSGLLDPDGYAYLVAYRTGAGGPAPTLQAINADGFLRYAADGKPLPAGTAWPRILRWDDRLVVSAGEVTSMLRTDTGEEIWETWLPGALRRSPDVAVIARSGDRLVTAVLEPHEPARTCGDGSEDIGTRVFGLDPFGGVAWDAAYSGPLRQRGVADDTPDDEASTAQGLAVDPLGGVHFSIGRCDGDDVLVSLDGDGNEVRRTPVPCRGCEVLAATEDLVYLAGGLVVPLAEGEDPWAVDLPAGFAPRLNRSVGYVLGDAAIHRLDLDAHDVSWTYPMPLEDSELRDAILTSPAGNVLAFDLRRPSASDETWITELSASGDVKRSCAMGGFAMEGTPAIGDEWILAAGRSSGRTQLRRFTVPKLQLGGVGWVSAGGSALRDGAAR